jgi:hypothetical protein
MKQADNDRLAEWLEAGMPADDESLAKWKITEKDMRVLNKRLMRAIAAKMTRIPGKIVLAEHRTVQ